MKLRNLFYLLLALPLVFAACSDDTTDPTPQPDKEYAPELTLTSEATMEFAAEGGEGVITYTAKMVEVTREADIDTKPEVEATCEAAWIENLTVSENITFTVAVNEGEARETKIVVTYSDKSFEVAVKQTAKQGDDPVVEEPVLTLTSEATLEFAAEGGAGEITYTLENAQEGVELTAECAAEWVTDLTAGEKVTFTVAANDGDARDTKIVVAYGTQKFEVVVKQDAKVFVPQAPTEFVPVKVKASFYDTGNFIVNLFVNDTKYHEFDMYDEVNPNNDNLSDGTYTSEDGTIGLADSYFYNGSKSVAMASAELTLKLNDDWTVTITGEFASEEGQAHTINWTGAVEGFKYANQPMTYQYEITTFDAQARTTTIWDLNLSETDPMLGQMFTRITIQMAEENAMHITDGVYSVENGGILVNSSDNNSYSTWRHNAAGADINICEVTVTNDLEAETSVIEGYFQIGINTYEFKYEGKVDGFMYKDLGDAGITAWDNVYVRSAFDDCKVLMMEASGFTGEFYLHKLGAKKSDALAAAVYTVGGWEFTTSRDYCEDASSKTNGVRLQSGEVVVETAGDGYKVTFNVVDQNGTEWKGTYTGGITQP